MNGGLRSLGGRLERRKSRSALHFVAPLHFISKPISDWLGVIMYTPMKEQHKDVGIIAKPSCRVLLVTVSRVDPNTRNA
jgi:hypothetical protein